MTAKVTGPKSFTDLLQQLGSNSANSVDAIRVGFPVSLMKEAGQYFDVPAQRIQAIIQLSETTAQNLSKRGVMMDASASERIWRLADVMHMACEVFDDEEMAKAWLRTPNLSFHRAAPMDYLDTEPGAIAVRQVLNAIATGGAL